MAFTVQDLAAPIHTVQVTIKACSEWYNQECKISTETNSKNVRFLSKISNNFSCVFFLWKFILIKILVPPKGAKSGNNPVNNPAKEDTQEIPDVNQAENQIQAEAINDEMNNVNAWIILFIDLQN